MIDKSQRNRHELHLHPRALLSAAAREPLAGGDRAAGLAPIRTTTGTSASRPSATRRTPPRASSTTTGRIAADRQQLRPHQLQLRPDAALPGWRRQRPETVPADPGGRRAEPGAVLRPRLGHGAGVQPHDHAAGQPARQASRRCSWGIRDFEHRFGRPAGGHVAARDGRRSGDARRPRRARDRVHDPGAAPGPARVRRSAATSVERRRRRRASTRRGLLCTTAVRPENRSVLLRRPDLPRRSPSSGCSTAARRFAERLLSGFADESRLGRSSSTSPPTARRYGHHHRHGDMALAYALRSHRARGPATAHELRRVPGAPPADARGGDRREHAVELRPRRRALAQRLRLQLGRPPGLEPGVARPAARGARLAARRRGAALSRQRAGAFFADPWAARDDYIDVVLDRSPGRSSTGSSSRHADRELHDARAVGALQAAGAAAARHADVHELRLVLRRAVRHRDGPVHPVRRAGHPAGATNLSEDVETAFLEKLSQAKSNILDKGDGARSIANLHSEPSSTSGKSPHTTLLPRGWSRPPTCAACIATKSSARHHAVRERERRRLAIRMNSDLLHDHD